MGKPKDILLQSLETCCNQCWSIFALTYIKHEMGNGITSREGVQKSSIYHTLHTVDGDGGEI